MNVLRYLTRNALVENSTKTSLVYMNQKGVQVQAYLIFKIEDVDISPDTIAKLLVVINFDDNQGWSPQASGTGGMIPSLNSRLFIIKRLRNSFCKSRQRRIADSLFISNIRYGLPLLGKVRINNEDPKEYLLTKVQKNTK